MRTSRADSLPALWGDEHNPRDDWYLHWISTAQEMLGVLEAVAKLMTDLGYSQKDIFGTRLAVEEAICNAIKHGHQNDPSKTVEIRYCHRGDHFLVGVKDEGPGFDRSAVPDATAPENLERPSGRGLLLIRHYAAWVSHNRAGNCVTFCICPSQPLPVALTSEPILEDLLISPYPIEA